MRFPIYVWSYLEGSAQNQKSGRLNLRTTMGELRDDSAYNEELRSSSDME